MNKYIEEILRMNKNIFKQYLYLYNRYQSILNLDFYDTLRSNQIAHVCMYISKEKYHYNAKFLKKKWTNVLKKFYEWIKVSLFI